MAVTNWYYVIGDDQHGPVGENDVLQMIAAGELHGDDLLWQAGMPDWVPVEQVFPGSAIAMGIEMPPLQETAQDEQAPKTPAHHTGNAKQETELNAHIPVTDRHVRQMPRQIPGADATAPVHSLAIVSVVLAVASVFVCVTAVPAVITGHMALAQIKREPERYGGKPVALVGLILGYLFLLPAVLFVFLLFLSLFVA